VWHITVPILSIKTIQEEEELTITKTRNFTSEMCAISYIMSAISLLPHINQQSTEFISAKPTQIIITWVKMFA